MHGEWEKWETLRSDIRCRATSFSPCFSGVSWNRSSYTYIVRKLLTVHETCSEQNCDSSYLASWIDRERKYCNLVPCRPHPLTTRCMWAGHETRSSLWNGRWNQSGWARQQPFRCPVSLVTHSTCIIQKIIVTMETRPYVSSPWVMIFLERASLPW